MHRSVSSSFRFAVFTAGLTACFACSAIAGDPPHNVTTDEDLWADDDREAYAVEIASDDPGTGTNADHPDVTLRIVETLRGQAREGDEIAAKWMPVPCGVEVLRDTAKIAAWQSSKLPVPAKGSRWLVISYALKTERPFRAPGRARYEWTEENRARCLTFTIGWQERLQKRAEEAKAHAAALAKRKEEDPAVQEKVDIADAVSKSTYIVVGKLEIHLGTSVMVKVEERLRGSGDPGAIRIIAPRDEDAALTIEARAGTRVIAFLHGQNHATCGAVSLKPVGGVNGMLTATPERLEKVREALGIEAPAK